MEVNVALWGELLLFSHFCRTNHQMETLSLMYMPACRCIIVLRECLRKARSCSCTVNSTYLVWNQNLATCIPNFLQLGLDLSLASFIRPSFWDVSRVSTPRMPVHTLAAWSNVHWWPDRGLPEIRWLTLRLQFGGHSWSVAHDLYYYGTMCHCLHKASRNLWSKYSFAYLCHLTRKRTLNGIAQYAPKV